MLRMLPFLLLLVLAVFCLVEAISARPDRVRNLPKWAWIVLILLFPLLGSIAWLVVGRPAPVAPGSSFPPRQAPPRATNPEDDAEFLRKVRERAEEQRRKHAEEKKREQEKPDGS
jgi:hypothetical protein